MTGPAPRTDVPEYSVVDQAASGRWWTSCARPGCDFYSSCIPSRAAAVASATIHQASHSARIRRRAG